MEKTSIRNQGTDLAHRKLRFNTHSAGQYEVFLLRKQHRYERADMQA